MNLKFLLNCKNNRFLRSITHLQNSRLRRNIRIRQHRLLSQTELGVHRLFVDLKNQFP